MGHGWRTREVIPPVFRSHESVSLLGLLTKNEPGLGGLSEKLCPWSSLHSLGQLYK